MHSTTDDSLNRATAVFGSGRDRLRAEQMSFTVPGPLRLFADALGPEGGPSVLMLHGGGQTRKSWARSARRLAELGYATYCLDARGHGESDRDPLGDYTLEAFRRDLGSVVDQIGEAPILIGASLGGIASLLCAGEGGRSVARAVILADIAVRTNPSGVSRIHAFMQANPRGFASLAEASEAVARCFPDRPRQPTSEGLHRNLREMGGRYYWHWDNRFLDSWQISHASSFARLERAASRIEVPLLLLHAEHSEVIGPAEVAHLRGLAPHAEYVRIGGASHMVAGDRNVAFNDAIVEFLDRHGFLSHR